MALLAVDLGLRTGLAVFGRDGRLIRYRSQHFGNQAALRRAAGGMLREIQGLEWVVMEGGGALADLWMRLAERRGIGVLHTTAEVWRQSFLYPREQRGGRRAKRNADDVARRVIEWSGAPRPTSLRHDAAEAILIGLWGVLEVGWLEKLPDSV